MKFIHNIPELLERRRKLRKSATPQENLLWFYLRARKLKYKFRRQYSINYYVADFCCAEKRLIVEVDGENHDTPSSQEYDLERDNMLCGLGYSILRIKNTEIDENIEKVIEKIQNALEYTSP